MTTTTPQDLDAVCLPRADPPSACASLSASHGVETNTDPVTEGKLAALDWFLGYGERPTDPERTTVAIGEPTSRTGTGRAA